MAAHPHRDEATPSRRRATIYAVAQRAGVSTATVSRTLAGSDKVAPRTREAVFAAVEELDYVPEASARALAGRRTRALGAVLPHIDGAYYAELLVSFEMAASRLGLSVVITLANPREDCRAALRALAGQVDGLAFMARSAATDQLIDEIAARRPVVTVARSQVAGGDALFVEHRSAATALTAHLLGTGRTRPVFIGTPEPGSDLAARFAGYRDAVLDRPGGIDPAQRDAAPVESDGLRVAEELIAQGVPYDAIVCGNDELAVAIQHRLQDHGVRIGHDVAVTGWDDIVTARYVRPGLTTVHQPVGDLGALAAQRLAARIDGAPVDPVPVELPTRIVHRSSCGCPPGAAMLPADRPPA